MGKIIAICKSDKKGTAKYQINEALLKEDHGIEGDAHAGNWHRQVSLLSVEKIEEFRSKGAQVDFGAFGENLVVEGFDLRSLPVGTRFAIGDTLLELTQIGKECHDHCNIYKTVGDCIMPREGVFTKVIKGGKIAAGDNIELINADNNRPFSAAVITLSDRASSGTYEDESGPLIEKILLENGYDIIEKILIPDNKALLRNNLIRLSDQRQASVIFTTGGTGFSEKDITPEVTEEVCDRMTPGISLGLISKSLEITPHAMLSRQTSGIRKKTLIINLPGSPKACRENLDTVLPALKHGLGVLRGSEDG